MAKLYPPQIEGNLPAFYDKSNILVPYELNKAVSLSEVTKIHLMVKKVSSNLLIYEGDNIGAFDQGIARFSIGDNILKAGQYYKFQLAFKDNNEIGYYSTPGIIKYINKPETYILDLSSSSGNVNKTLFTGIFDPKDSGEFLYSSRFVLESDGEILVDSGEILHDNSDVDKDGKSTEIFKLNYNLLPNKKYYLIYTTTTGNGYVESSPSYLLVDAPLPQPDINAELMATNDYENGCINLSLVPTSSNNATGCFNIVRAKSSDNYTLWEQVIKFDLADEQPSKPLLYRDYLVEHGVTYLYALQQYNTYGFYSKKIYSDYVKSEFEDTFLLDGDRQLNIRFNPKVTSFKTTLLESKIDTLGGQYPFIFRNGSVNYKEFPISGLISYLSDPYHLFLEEKELKSGLVLTTDLTDENIYIERKFKTEVYDWLTNGKVKYFKSPVEGSFLVRLMNVSLAPNDQVGRMLHSFSATAYEIGDTSEEQLVYYQLKDLEKTLPASGVTIRSIKDVTTTQAFTNVKNIQMYNITIDDDVIDNDVTIEDDIVNIIIQQKNGPKIADLVFTANQASYFLDLPLEGTIQITPYGGKIGILTVAYKKSTLPTDKTKNDFNKITNVQVDSNITIIQKTAESLNDKSDYDSNNIIDMYKYINSTLGSNKQISSFSYLQLSVNSAYTPDNKTRPTCYKAYINNTEIDLAQTKEYQLRNFDITSLKVGLGIIVECGYYAQTITYTN